MGRRRPDGRTKIVREYKRARAQLLASIPDPTPAQRVLIDQAAVLRARTWALDDHFLRGGEVSVQECWLRLNTGHALARVLAQLGMPEEGSAEPLPSLREYLAQRADSEAA